MHGLVNRGIQNFVTDTFGRGAWRAVCDSAGLDFTDFEAMMRYEKQHTPDIQTAMVAVLGRPLNAMMEDLGTYLITNPDFPAVRRLLRFSGVTFHDFLHSLDDLPDRVRLAVPDLHLPRLSLFAPRGDQFYLRCDPEIPGFDHVMIGVLRAMADDYGVLALIDHAGQDGPDELITIALVQTDFTDGRLFELGRQAG